MVLHRLSLVNGQTEVNLVCNIELSIISSHGLFSDGIGVMPGDNVTEIVITQVYCPGTSIVDTVSSVPVGMTKSSILNPSTSQ